MPPTENPYPNTNWPALRVPTYQGASGRAWKWVLKDEKIKEPQNVGQYLLCCPGANPFWWWYLLGMVNLRDHEGVDPAYKLFPEAQYEILVVTLNPEYPVPEPQDEPDENTPLRTLMPPDQRHQIGALPRKDDDAIEFLDKIAWACTQSILVPDEDYRTNWARSIELSYEHVTTGGHGGHSHG